VGRGAALSKEPKRLYRSRTDRKITGVLGGWAAYLGADPSLVRIGYVLVTVLTGFFPGILLYLLMVFVIPVEPGAD
jgi:phage shock protein C